MAISSQTNTTQTSTIVGSSLDLALQTIASVDVPQGKHIALAYSGSQGVQS